MPGLQIFKSIKYIYIYIYILYRVYNYTTNITLAELVLFDAELI